VQQPPRRAIDDIIIIIVIITNDCSDKRYKSLYHWQGSTYNIAIKLLKVFIYIYIGTYVIDEYSTIVGRSLIGQKVDAERGELGAVTVVQTVRRTVVSGMHSSCGKTCFNLFCLVIHIAIIIFVQLFQYI